MLINPKNVYGVHQTDLRPEDRQECHACGMPFTAGVVFIVWTNAGRDFVACSQPCAQLLEQRRALGIPNERDRARAVAARRDLFAAAALGALIAADPTRDDLESLAWAHADAMLAADPEGET